MSANENVNCETGRPRPLAFVGRAAELAALSDSLMLTLDGASGTCLIMGDAGIGKTRLLGELLDRARAQHCHVLTGRAQLYDQGVPYTTLKELLASAAARPLPVAASEALTAALRAADQTDEPNADTASAPSTAVLTTDFLRVLLGSRPTVVALDDAHLADAQTLTALCLAARHLATRPLLLVFTARRDQWESFALTLGRLVESTNALLVELNALAAPDVTALLAALLAGPPDDRLAAQVFEQSRGNPLFAEQALLALQTGHAVRQDHGRFYLAGQSAPGPAHRRTALLHRVFQQDQDSRTVARVLSAFKRIHLDHVWLVGELAQLPVERLHSAFDRLTEASILAEADAGWFQFVHPLLAGVLYDDLGPAERRRVHRLICDALSAGTLSGRMGLLDWATHVTEAASPGDQPAIEAALRAATATGSSAPLAAATWLQRALDLMPPQAEQRAELLARQAVAYWKGSRPDSAVGVGAKALAALPDGRLRTRTLATVVNATFAAGHISDALGLVSDERSRAQEHAPFLAQQALMLAHLGESGAVRATMVQAEQAAAASPLAEQAVAYSYLGHVYSITGPYSAVVAAADRLHAIGTSPELLLPRGARLSALESASYIVGVAGALPRAREMLRLTHALLPQTGWQDVGGQNVYAEAATLFQAGEWTAALDRISLGVVSLDFAGLTMNLAYLRLLEARILLERGEYTQAAEVLSAGTAPAESAYYLSLRACLRARISLSRRPDPAALLVLREQRDLGREHRWVEVHQLALESLAGWDCEDDSQQASEELSDLAARCAMPKVAHTANVVATSVTGKCEPAGQTLARAQADGLRFVEAKARYALGCAGEDPAGNFGQAITLFESMGAPTWVKAVLSGARERGVSLPRPKVNQASNALTPTEWQMVRFVRDGLSNPEISQVMHYSRKTVEAYLSRLYRKTGCQSRVELVVALERGELGLDDPR